MKKLALVLAGVLVLGATSMVADSEVNTNDNLNVNVVADSEVKDSTIGTDIVAEDSTVNANDNLNVNIVAGGKVEDSIVGAKIKAK
jgi:hypothetical protein